MSWSREDSPEKEESQTRPLNEDSSFNLRSTRSGFRRVAWTLVTLTALASSAFLLITAWPSAVREEIQPYDFLDLEIVPLSMESPNFETKPRSVSLGTCVGQVLDASTWTSNLGLKVAAAVQECDPSNFGPGGTGSARTSSNLAAFCTRTILTVIRDVDQVARFMTVAAQTCKPIQNSNETACATAITSAVFAGTNLARFVAELTAFCDQPVINVHGFFPCANRLEALAWQFDSFASGVARSAQKCVPPGTPVNFGAGACTGEIAAASAYLASAGLYLTTAIDTNCQRVGNAPTSALRKRQQAQCARDILAFNRMLGLASAMFNEAAGHCSRLDTACGSSISFGATALVGAGEAAADMARFCSPSAGQQNSEQCARFTSSMTKLLFTAAGFATQANGQCKGKRLATNACGANTAKAIAGFGFLAENVARAARDCKNPGRDLTFFGCGQRIGFIGDAVDTSSRTIGAAIANCGFGNVVARSKPIPLRRRFFVP